MKLAQRIYELRKKAGLSQQELADRLNVSRQAVSKWETGESTPEVAKLLELSQVFSVTVDDLLTGEEPQPSQPPPPQTAAMPSWVEHLPEALQRLFRRYGWLLGVYVALGGAAFSFLGILARAMSCAMTGSMNSMMVSFPGSQADWLDTAGNAVSTPFAQQGGLELFSEVSGSAGTWMDQSFSGLTAAMTSPFDVMANGMIIFGAVLIIAGVCAAVMLKKYGRNA